MFLLGCFSHNSIYNYLRGTKQKVRLLQETGESRRGIVMRFSHHDTLAMPSLHFNWTLDVCDPSVIDSHAYELPLQTPPPQTKRPQNSAPAPSIFMLPPSTATSCIGSPNLIFPPRWPAWSVRQIFAIPAARCAIRAGWKTPTRGVSIAVPTPMMHDPLAHRTTLAPPSCQGRTVMASSRTMICSRFSR